MRSTRKQRQVPIVSTRKHIFYPVNTRVAPTGLLLDDFYTRPCTLAELFTLVALTFRGSTHQNFETNQFWFIMEALDPFDFSEAVVDRLLRPQMMACLRHAMCRPR